MPVRLQPFRSNSSPLLARVSGLPASTIEEFSSDLCGQWFPGETSRQQELAATRAELVERLHGLVRLVSPELRRFLLNVKRDAFNARSLARLKADNRWSELAGLAGSPADRVASLEENLESWRDGYASAYRRQRAREHRALLAALENPGFRRGLALASPVLAEAAERARRAGSGISSGRRESRLDLSLLRYVSRATLKLSPFSTLTRVALGKIGGEAAAPIAWIPGGWSERSLLRVRRYLAEQDVELLRRYRPFRDGLEVALNPSLEETAPERYRLLRPERWVPDVEAGKLRHENASLIEMSLPGTLVACFFGELRQGPRIFRELAASRAAELGGVEAAAVATATLDALVEAGVLLLETPWPGNEPHLEKRLLAHLRTLPQEDGLTAAVEALDRLVALEEGFAAAPEPAQTVVEIDRVLDDLWQATAALAGLAPGIERSRNKPRDFCEDVLLVSAPGEPEAFQVPRGTVRDLVRSAAPWARLAAFQGTRFDFLHTMAAFQRQRWPGRAEVGFLELFAAAQPLWREYRKLTSGRTGAAGAAFNPLGLAEIDSLAHLRTEIWSRLRETLRALPAGEPLPIAVLEELAERIPERYAAAVGPCLFVQPADATGNLWVLNRIFEGTGRYGSRFTAVMDPETRHRYAGPYLQAAVRDVDGEPADLLDLMWSRGDTLNVHAVQTARVLALPGETLDRNAAEPVALRDLRVSVDIATELPRLADAAGRRLLPVHLGGTNAGMMPFLVQFLAQWGPGEVRPPSSPVPAHPAGSGQVLERLTAGCLVLARRRWVVSLGEDLRRQAAAADDEAAFVAVNRWRLEQDLPERLFWIEKTHHELVGEVYKPQYLDFTSPLFVEVFRSALRLNGDPLTFEEMLPAAGDLPPGPQGERWAVELHLDTLPLEPDELSAELAGESGTTVWPSLAAGGRFV
jgi:hypothetical protein